MNTMETHYVNGVYWILWNGFVYKYYDYTLAKEMVDLIMYNPLTGQ